MKIRMNISTYDEWFNRPVDAAEVEIPSPSAQVILGLAEVCKEHDIYKVSRFENPLALLSEDYESEEDLVFTPYEGRVECVTLNVTTTNFFWSGVYKHTNIRWETDSIPLETLTAGEVFVDLCERR